MEEKQIYRDKDGRILDRKSGTITSRMSELCREEPESRGVNTILGEEWSSLVNIDAVGLLLLNTRHALGAFQFLKSRSVSCETSRIFFQAALEKKEKKKKKRKKILLLSRPYNIHQISPYVLSYPICVTLPSENKTVDYLNFVIMINMSN